MLVRKPVYYDQFVCWAGRCPDTCCAVWDIVIDPNSEAFYRTLSGTMGERIRAAMTVDEDGDPCFQVSGGCCPLLTEERLCSIQLELGEERVCDTCRSHPRFTEEYGTFRELSLAASCPAAMELLMQEDWALMEMEDDSEVFSCEDVNEELLSALLPCRETAWMLLQRTDLPWEQRLWALLAFGSTLQLALLSEGSAALPVLAQQWKEITVDALNFQLKDGAVARCRCVELLQELEILEPAWSEKIAQVLEHGTSGDYNYVIHESLEQRWVAYLLWRWFLRADFDADIYSKLALPVVSILMLRVLNQNETDPRVWKELARCWAKEIEHSAENRVAIYEAVCTEWELAPECLMDALRTEKEK